MPEAQSPSGPVAIRQGVPLVLMAVVAAPRKSRPLARLTLGRQPELSCARHRVRGIDGRTSSRRLKNKPGYDCLNRGLGVGERRAEPGWRRLLEADGLVVHVREGN